MVFFTCNVCGESLKKNKVERHLQICKSGTVSCLDCNKDFDKISFNSHVQCVSEDQKYGGTNFKQKEGSNKGKIKQELWLQQIRSVLNDSNSKIPNNIKGLLEQLLNYDNIPRKKQKFINFLKNCLRVRNEYYAETMWEIFENAIKADNASNGDTNVSDDTKAVDTKEEQPKNKRQIEEINETKDFERKSKKIKSEQKSVEEVSGTTNEVNGVKNNAITEGKSKLKMDRVIKDILKEAENNEISLNELKEKVLSVCKTNQLESTDEEILSKLELKLNNSKKFIIKVAMVRN